MTTTTLDSARPGPARPGPSRHQATKVTQARVVRSEWTKLTSLRSTVFTLLAALVIMIGFGAIICAATAANWDDFDSADRAGFDPTSLSLAGMFLAQLAIGALGVLVISGEYSTGMIRASLGAVPRRLPVLWAKAAVFGAVAFVLMLVSSLAAFGVGQALLASENIDVSLSDPGVFRAVLGAAFYLTVVGLLGLAFGAILRSTPGAITTLFGVVLVLPILVDLLPSNLDGIGKYLPGGGAEAVTQVVSSPGVLSSGAGVLLLCGYVAAAIAAAGYLLVRRDA